MFLGVALRPFGGDDDIAPVEPVGRIDGVEAPSKQGDIALVFGFRY